VLVAVRICERCRPTTAGRATPRRVVGDIGCKFRDRNSTSSIPSSAAALVNPGRSTRPNDQRQLLLEDANPTAGSSKPSPSQAALGASPRLLRKTWSSRTFMNEVVDWADVNVPYCLKAPDSTTSAGATGHVGQPDRLDERLHRQPGRLTASRPAANALQRQPLHQLRVHDPARSGFSIGGGYATAAPTRSASSTTSSTRAGASTRRPSSLGTSSTSDGSATGPIDLQLTSPTSSIRTATRSTP